MPRTQPPPEAVVEVEEVVDDVAVDVVDKDDVAVDVVDKVVVDVELLVEVVVIVVEVDVEASQVSCL